MNFLSEIVSPSSRKIFLEYNAFSCQKLIDPPPSSESCVALQKENKKLEQRNAELIQRNEVLVKDTIILTQQSSQLEAKQAALQSQKQECESQLADLQRQWQALQQQKAVVSEKAFGVSAVAEKEQQECDKARRELQAKYDALAADVAQRAQRQKEIEAEYADVNRRVKECRDAKTLLEKQFTDLQRDHAALLVQKEECVANGVRLGQELETIKAANARHELAQKECETLRVDIQLLRAQAADHEKALAKALNDQLVSLKDECDKKQEEQKQAMEKQQKELRDLLRQQDVPASDAKAAVVEAAEAAEKAAKAETERVVAAAAKAAQEAATRIEIEVRHVRDECDTQVAALQKQLQAATEKTDQTEKQYYAALDKAKEVNAAFEKQIAEIQDAQKKELAALQKEYDAAREQWTQLAASSKKEIVETNTTNNNTITKYVLEIEKLQKELDATHQTAQRAEKEANEHRTKLESELTRVEKVLEQVQTQAASQPTETDLKKCADALAKAQDRAEAFEKQVAALQNEQKKELLALQKERDEVREQYILLQEAAKDPKVPSPPADVVKQCRDDMAQLQKQLDEAQQMVRANEQAIAAQRAKYEADLERIDAIARQMKVQTRSQSGHSDQGDMRRIAAYIDQLQRELADVQEYAERNKRSLTQQQARLQDELERSHSKVKYDSYSDAKQRELQDELDRVTRKMKTCTDQNREFNKTVEELKAQLKQKQTNLKHLSNVETKLTRIKTTSKNSSNNTREEHQWETERQKLLAEMDDINAELKQTREKLVVAMAEKEKNQLENECNEVRTKLKTVETQLIECQKDIKTTTTSTRSATKLAFAKTQKQWENERDELKKKLDRLQNELNQLKQPRPAAVKTGKRKAAVSTTSTDLQHKITVLETTVERLEHEKTTLKKEYEDQQLNIETDKKEWDKRANAYAKQAEEHAAVAHDCNEQLQILKLQNNELVAKIQQIQDKALVPASKLEGIQAELEKCHEDVKKCHDGKTRLEKQLRNCNDRNDSLKKQLRAKTAQTIKPPRVSVADDCPEEKELLVFLEHYLKNFDDVDAKAQTAKTSPEMRHLWEQFKNAHIHLYKDIRVLVAPPHDCNTLRKRFSDMVDRKKQVLEVQEPMMNLSEDIASAVRTYVRIKPLVSDNVVTVEPDKRVIFKSGKCSPWFGTPVTAKFGPFYGAIPPSFNNAQLFTGCQVNQQQEKCCLTNNDVGLCRSIQQIAQGYHICIFGYGHSGSGKSYSLFGNNDPEAGRLEQGIVQMALGYFGSELKEVRVVGICELVFDDIDFRHGGDRKSSGKMIKLYSRQKSYFDSLHDEPNLVHPEKNDIEGIAAQPVTADNIHDLIDAIEKHRTRKDRITWTTNNPNSSRSHLFLTLEFTFHDKGTSVGGAGPTRGRGVALNTRDASANTKSKNVASPRARATSASSSIIRGKSASPLSDRVASLSSVRKGKLTVIDMGGRESTEDLLDMLFRPTPKETNSKVAASSKAVSHRIPAKSKPATMGTVPTATVSWNIPSKVLGIFDDGLTPKTPKEAKIQRKDAANFLSYFQPNPKNPAHDRYPQIVKLLKESVYINESINQLIYFFKEQTGNTSAYNAFEYTQFDKVKGVMKYNETHFLTQYLHTTNDSQKAREKIGMYRALTWLKKDMIDALHPTKFIMIVHVRDEKEYCKAAQECLEFAESIRSN